MSQDSRMMVASDFRAIGGVSPRDVRVSERWKGTATRAVGTALNDDGTPHLVNGRASVKVIRNGIVSYVPASHFGRDSKSRTTRTRSNARVIETARIALKGMDWNQ